MRALLLTTALIAPLAAFAQDDQAERDRGFLTGLIEDNLSSTARRVTIEGFAGALSSRATVERLTISDGEGVWLDARDLVLDWNRSALFGGRLEVDELAAGSIEILRAPVPDPAAVDLPSAEATPFALPELPVAIRIGRLQAGRIVLGEPILGQEIVLTLDGAVDLSGGEGTADVRAEIVEGSEGSLVLAGSYSNAARLLDLTLDLQEAPNGLLANALDLPGKPSVDLSLAGSDPVDDFTATIRLATDGEPRVEGTVRSAVVEGTAEGDATPRAFDLALAGDVTPLVDPELATFFGNDLAVALSATRDADGGLDLSRLAIDAQSLSLDGTASLAPEGWPERIALTGTLGAPGGEPVAVPGAAGTTVRSAGIDLAYDAAEGEGWSGRFEVADLARPGTTIDALTVEGSGAIVPGADGADGSFSADVAYAARGLAFVDEGLAEALGADITGTLALQRPEDGGPVRIERLTVEGPGVTASLEGTVAGPEAGFLAQTSTLLVADDLGRFAELSGLDLAGAADVTLVSSVRPLDGIFDLILDGTTADLRLGIDPLDPLLAGAGTIRVSAARDEAGTRVEELAIETPAARVTGTADITSGQSVARLDLAVTDLGLAVPTLPGPARIAVDATRDAVGLIVLDAEADLPGASVSLAASQPGAIEDAATGDDVSQPVTVSLRAAVEELADFGPLLAGLELPVAPAGGADLAVAGTVAPDGSTFDVTLTAETSGLALGDPRLDPLLAGEGRVAGRAIRTGPLDLSVEGLRVTTDLVDASIDAALVNGAISADVDVAVDEVASLLDGLSGPARVVGTAARTPEGATDLDMTATLPQGTARVDGTLAPSSGGSAFTGEAEVALADLAPFAGLVGRDLAGGVTARAEGTVRPDLSVLDLTVDATGTDLALGLPQIDPLLAGATRVQGTVSRAADLSAVIDLAATLEGGTVAVDGTLAAPEAGGGPLTQAFDGTVDADLADLSVLSGLAGRPLAGALDATATGFVRGDLAVLDLTVDATGTDLALGLPQVDPLLRGATSVAGTVARAADGSATVDVDATLAGGTASVTGTLAPAAEGSAFTGDVAVDVADLSPLSGLAGTPLGGALAATASGTVRPDLTVLDVTFDATSRDLRTGLAPVDPLLAGAGTFSGTVERSPEGGVALALVADTPLLDADVARTFMENAGNARFDVSVAEVASLLPGLSGPASATGTATRAADGTIAVDADATAPGAVASVKATVAPPAQGYRIDGTADVSVANLAPYGALVGQPLSGAVDATVSGTLLPSLARFDLGVDATATSLSLGDPTLASLLAGTGTVTGRVTRDDGGLAAEDLVVRFPNFSVDADATQAGGTTATTFDARLADVGLFTDAIAGPATATGTATIAGGTTTLAADVTGPEGIAARVAGTVAPTPDLTAIGTAPLALLDPFISPRTLAGSAAFDLRLAGSFAPEALSGTVRIADARVADPSLGEALTGVGGTVTLSGGTARVDLAGALIDGGRLSAQGSVGLAAPFVADLAVAGDGLVLRDPSLYEAQASARLTIAGPLAGGARIAGAVQVASVEVRVPSSAIGALGDLPPVFHLRPSPAVAATLSRADAVPGAGASGAGGGSSGGGYGLDVTVNAPARVFVRGRGLDAELGGSLRLTGTTSAIVPAGAVSLIRGRLEILGQRFDLTEGTATLQGDFEPFLRFVAETTARTGTVVRIILEGPASEPTVTFTSTPELPEDEVLAQLIFGVDLDSITPLQAVQLASGVATLAGRGGGLIDSLRGDAGLADLDITTDAAGNAALRLGRYISENVYTDVIVSTEETEATINLDLSPDLTVRAGVSSDGETSVGIEFARDY